MSSRCRQEAKEYPLEGGDGTIDDLKQALVENFEHRGVLGKLKAKVRAEVFHTLEGPQDGLLPPPLSNENLLINELVREYLSYNGYTNALGVFMAESGQPSDRSLDRGFIKDELGLAERRDSAVGREVRPLPLLYGIAHALKKRRREASEWSPHYEGDEEGDGGAGGAYASSAAGTDVVRGSRADINWADPAPVLFTKRGGAGGGGDHGGT
eukprot:g5235.t1